LHWYIWMGISWS